VPGKYKQKNITAERAETAETAEIFLKKKDAKKGFESFIFSAYSALSAVNHYFFFLLQIHQVSSPDRKGTR
jgi:hypothetical protein